MPRRDGHATNREKLSDFTIASRDLFVTLYNIDFQEHFPRAFEDKPLNSLGVYVLKQYFPHDRLRTSIQKEGLTISPLQQFDVDIMRHNCLQTRHFPPDVFDYYETIASRIADVAIRTGLDISNIIPPNGVIADYTAHFPDRPRCHVGTLKDMPNKQIIASALYFVDEAHQCAVSEHPSLPLEERVRKAKKENNDGIITHSFRIEIRPEVPLNGYESTQFLGQYRDTMIQWHREAIRYIEKSSHLSKTLLDGFKKQAAEYKAAADRAQAILDDR
jgi:hypothetical protein